MKVIGLDNVKNADFGLFSVLAIPQFWQNGREYKMPASGRADSGLMYITDCVNTIKYGDKVVVAKKGQIVYLPQGLSYTSYFERESHTDSSRPVPADLLLNFTLVSSQGVPSVFSRDVTVLTPTSPGELFDLFSEACEKSGSLSPLSLKALAYKIITEFANLTESETQKEGGFSENLSTALGYVRENYQKSTLSVREIALHCHISCPTLRRLFTREIGCSPKEYVNRIRLERALVLLRGHGITVSEAAFVCGFEDASYFSRFLKKHTGKSPGQYLKEAENTHEAYLQ